MSIAVGDRVYRLTDGIEGTVVEVDDTTVPYYVEWDGDGYSTWMLAKDVGPLDPPIEDTTPFNLTDMVNHPPHYNTGSIEVIDFIEDQGLEYHEANALKYITRAGKKNPDTRIEDLEKAVWYLNRKLTLLKGESDG